MTKLGVNVDHVATLRQARGEDEPDPIHAAKICMKAGADSIVAHLREDRRHMNDADIKKLRKTIKSVFNLEMSLDEKIVKIAARIKPNIATLVPERRQEVTTEGGLDVIRHFNRIKRATRTLQKKEIIVSLFIDPKRNQILKTKETGATHIELHTGTYAHAKRGAAKQRELKKLKTMAKFAKTQGLHVAAGHGLKYHDTKPVAKIKEIEELNIGHSIVSKSIFTGLEKAVREMKKICRAK